MGSNCAEASSHIATRFLGVDCIDPGSANGHRRFCSQATDWPLADHGDGIARRNSRHLYAVVTGSKGIGQQQGLFIADPIGDSRGADIGVDDFQVLCMPAIECGLDTVGDAAVAPRAIAFTQVDLPRQAAAAHTTAGATGDQYLVSYLVPAYRGAHRHDFTDGFMAGTKPLYGLRVVCSGDAITVVHMQVRPADTAALYLDNQVAFIANRRVIERFVVNVFGAVEYQSFHCQAPSTAALMVILPSCAI